MFSLNEIALFVVAVSTFDLGLAEFLPNIGEQLKLLNETRGREYRLPANSFPPFHLALVVTSVAVLLIAVLGAICLYVRALQLSRKNPTIRITISDSKHSQKEYQEVADV
uniref:Col_cuticle_N domain-containing protein n=1 Tax=Steinernema glaseri TaxID=37863 RepID=A0A1I7Z6Q2_9BILA